MRGNSDDNPGDLKIGSDTNIPVPVEVTVVLLLGLILDNQGILIDFFRKTEPKYIGPHKQDDDRRVDELDNCELLN